MTHTPPVPQASQSPYPIQEAPHPHGDAPAETDGGGVDTHDEGIATRLSELPLVAIGAAIGLGAALVGGALFGLGRREQRGKRPRGRGRRR